jgi:integrase
MVKRNPLCGHDHVLHNNYSAPMRVPALIGQYNKILCKEVRGKRINETGWDKWSSHRLRHTMSTNLANGGADVNTIMKCGGWTTFEAAMVYTKINEDRARTGYVDAMRFVREAKPAETRKKTLTMAELHERRKQKCGQKLETEALERCV